MKRQVESAGSGPPPNVAAAWEEARQLLEQMRGGQDGLGAPLTGAATGFNPGMSAAGTEDFKQDFTRWDSLKQQIGAALERREASLAAQLRARATRDRLSAGGTQAVPPEYRSLVDKYFEALARDRK